MTTASQKPVPATARPMIWRPLRLFTSLAFAVLVDGCLQLGRRAPGSGLHGLAALAAKQPAVTLTTVAVLVALAGLELLRRQRGAC